MTTLSSILTSLKQEDSNKYIYAELINCMFSINSKAVIVTATESTYLDATVFHHFCSVKDAIHLYNYWFELLTSANSIEENLVTDLNIVWEIINNVGEYQGLC